MLSDIEIAQNAKMKHIRDVAASIGIAEDDLEFYGKYKAKIASELWGKVKDNENGKLILVTAINPNGRYFLSLLERSFPLCIQLYYFTI